MNAYRIATTAPLGQRQPRVKDAKHLEFIRRLDCIVCGSPYTEAAHLRMADAERGKRETGKAEKPSDCWCLPLCARHHREQHSHGDERSWWGLQGIDPLSACEALYAVSGDDIAGAMVVFKHGYGRQEVKPE